MAPSTRCTLVRAASFDETQGSVAVGEEHLPQVVGQMRSDVGLGIVERRGTGGSEVD